MRMERDAEGSKIKGPPPVRAGPHYHQLVPILHTKIWRLETKFPKSKKSLPLTRSLFFPRENTGKNYTTICPKIKSVTGLSNEFKSDAFPKDICFVNKS